MKALKISREQLSEVVDVQLEAANGLPIEAIGQTEVNLELEGWKTVAPIIFSAEQEGMLMSWFDSKALGILLEHYPKPAPVRAVHAAEPQKPTPARPKSNNTSSSRPTEAEIDGVKNKLLEEFSDVFDRSGPLKTMKGSPMKIELVEGAVPFAVHRPRPIPFAQRDAVKVALDSMIADNIIVPVTESSDWGHPMTVVEKADGSPRICVDLTRLNKFVKRPVYPPRSPKDAVACISGKARFFTTVDAVQGYHQVPLHEDSQHLTTFVTPWGRFKFLRGTMGLNATGDEYNRRSDEAVGGFLNTVKVVDDLLVYEETFEEHVERVRNMLQRCREHQITLSSGIKFSFARERVAWAGNVIGPGEISPDPAKLEHITKFPTPTNITEMCNRNLKWPRCY